MKILVYIIIVIAAILLTLAALEIRRLKKEVKLLKIKDFESTKHSAEQLQDLRIFKHDYKNMIFGLRALLNAGDYKNLAEYLTAIDSDFAKAYENFTAYSDNTLINAVLNRIAVKCREEDIPFEASVTVGKDLPMEDIDICTVFSNLADNAYEAVMRQTEGDKFISFSVSRREKWLIINVENSFNGEMSEKNGGFDTVKKDVFSHGLGLKSIKRIIESVPGAIFKAEPDTAEKVFHTSLIFPK